MFGRLHREDDGIALLVTLSVMIVASMLALLVVNLTIQSDHNAGVDRQRTLTINAAEAGVDSSYAQLESAAVATGLPCRWPSTGTYSLKSYPDPTKVAATITFYDANNNVLSCVNGALPSNVTPAAASIDSSATVPALGNVGAQVGSRHMQSYVKLVPIRQNGMQNAIFGNTTILNSNRSTISGDSSGPDANVYTNGNFSCSNNQTYNGSVIAPTGSISMANGCSVVNDVWAASSVSSAAGSSCNIGGRVIASSGAINLNGSLTVNGQLFAAQGISWSGCSAQNKCFPNQATAAPVAPSQPFPHILGDATTLTNVWQANGWTVINDNTCGTLVNKIKTQYGTQGGKVLVRTTCPVGFGNNDTVNFADSDFVLMADGGITTTQRVTFNSTSTSNVAMIVPWGTPCPQGAITYSNNFTSGSSGTVNMLTYTPCDVN